MAQTAPSMDRDGLVMAEPIEGSASGTTPVARVESPQDTMAHRRARTRFPFECLFFLCAVALQIFNLAAHYTFAVQTSDIATNAGTLNSSSVNVTGLLAEYAAFIAQDPANYDKACDVPYFAQEGFGTLRVNLNALKDATLAFFYIGIFPSVAFFIYVLGHLRALYHQRNRSLMETWHPVRNPNTNPIDSPGDALTPDGTKKTAQVYNNPLGRVNIGDVSVAGQIRRTERYALRGETSGYIVLQIMHDIPLVMIFFLYIAYTERYRGYDCAVCFANGQLCTVPYYFSLTFTDNYVLKVAMGACFLHVAWAYLSLCLRWIYYWQSFVPPWNFAKQFLAWFLSTLVFIASFVAPVAILFVAYVGPLYYGFEDLKLAIGLSGLGGGFWSMGLLVFVWFAGLEVGESVLSGLFCFNFWEFFYFALPCLDYCEETFTVCEIGQHECCGCCCCCC